MKTQIKLNINGEDYSVEVEPYKTLLDVLREQLDMSGTKNACKEGECGCCTVTINGKAVDSCLYPAIRAEGKKIQTIEGIAVGGELHPIQKAFIETGAIQCGFCTPGFIMSAKAYLENENPNPTEEDIRRDFVGNLCRCTGYEKIIEAIILASKRMKKK